MTRKSTTQKTVQFQIGFLVAFSKFFCVLGQNYEVADIDCAIGTGGKELLTARLRRPDGFRGMPIFADDRGQLLKEPSMPAIIPQELSEDVPCQILPDPIDGSGRVFKLRITDFSQCGVMKRNGFIHVRVWFPQLPGVVMLSDQEVIIMCKPPAATIVQSKTAGFAGSIPSGARISGIVEESPGRLEYEVALYRETATTSSLAARSSSSAYITGADSHELPVDQAVPIGTRLQLRAKINPDSAWKHAKLMEVSVSPDPKNPNADGSVSLVRDGCRNADLASIIPKQPYRYKERTNEVVLDFEAFLLSNMADRSTLWLHTQIKACMESQDCHPEFCMDVYQPSGYGKKRRRRNIHNNGHPIGATSSISMSKSNATSMDYSAPLSQHWTTFADEIIIDNASERDEKSTTVIKNSTKIKTLNELLNSVNSARDDPIGLISLPIPSSETKRDGLYVHKEDIEATMRKYLPKSSTPMTTTTTFRSTTTLPSNKNRDSGGDSTNFGDNIGFSVIMPSDYYRSTNVLSSSYECRAWATATLVSLLAAVISAIVACAIGYKMKRSGSAKERALYSMQPHGPLSNMMRPHVKDIHMSSGSDNVPKMRDSGQLFHKYARDPSIYRS
ncbi:uncharacterized protein LOC110848861 isoform X2 [Folsomia candida]|uniref:uncharacterized protein LOC110848861 isoform X2 n=1 Tax=Folsomia candida TaxID=158441 RepID=UPI0016051A80|nr:uncharacterized protein LOC110848861 isoform X2 [Folsomia candida]